MSEADKQPYTKLHDEDVVRYDTQAKSLRENGYFMTEDGKKSTDLEPKKIRQTKRVREQIKSEMAKVINQL